MAMSSGLGRGGFALALPPSIRPEGKVAVLGFLVLIRTFLGWSLAVEIDGGWPWQARPQKGVHGSMGREKTPLIEAKEG
jgi:hypothetical protein